MKVREMIDLLRKCNPDANVIMQTESEEMITDFVAMAKDANDDILLLNAEAYGWSSLEIIE